MASASCHQYRKWQMTTTNQRKTSRRRLTPSLNGEPDTLLQQASYQEWAALQHFLLPYLPAS